MYVIWPYDGGHVKWPDNDDDGQQVLLTALGLCLTYDLDMDMMMMEAVGCTSST